jgi:hypothetical protein
MALPPQDPTQQKLEKAVTKMPKPKELEAPELNQDQIPAPGSGPFGTSLIGAGSLPSAPTITSNVTGDRTPAPLLTTTTDIAKQTTQQQKEPMKMARYKLSRRMTFRDFNISIETDKGELRHWYDPHNKEKGTTKMTHPYGYIRRTKGVDGDHVDVYVGPNEQAKNVYIVHQMKAPEFKAYDEDKCMLGFDSAEAAKAAYLKNFNDNRFFGSMTTMPYDDFKKKVLKSFDLKRPHKIAEAIMNPHLKTAYLTGADMAKTAFEKEAFTLIEALIAAGLLGTAGGAGSGKQIARATEEGAGPGGRLGAALGGGTGGALGTVGGVYGGARLSNLLRRLPLPAALQSLGTIGALAGGGFGGYGVGQALGGRAGQAIGEAEMARQPGGSKKEGAAPPTAPTAVPIAAQPDVLGGLLDTAESGLSSAYQAGKAGLGKAYSVGESGLDRLLAALKKRPEIKKPPQKKTAGYGPNIITDADKGGPKSEADLPAETPSERPQRLPVRPLPPDPRTLPKPPMATNLDKTGSAALLKALLLAGGLGGAGYGLHQLTGSQTAENVSGERTRRGLEAAGLLGKEGQAMPAGEPMMPPEQAAADTAMPPEAAGAAPALGDPNFWAGGGAPGSAAAAAAGAQSAEEVIGLLPAGTFQGMNVRITPDGQKSTGLKVTPEAIDAPEALKAVFQAEPTARVEITTPETPASVTSFREQG